MVKLLFEEATQRQILVNVKKSKNFINYCQQTNNFQIKRTDFYKLKIAVKREFN